MGEGRLTGDASWTQREDEIKKVHWLEGIKAKECGRKEKVKTRGKVRM